jgi:hypothetical protein
VGEPRSGIWLYATALASQFLALAASYLGLYQMILVPRLDTMREIGSGWLLLLSLPTLATTGLLAALVSSAGDVVMVALGSGLGVTSLLFVCSVLGSPGFRKASEVDVPWVFVLLACWAAFILLGGLSSAARRLLRRSATS